MEKVKVGVIEANGIGSNFHIPRYKSLPGVELLAFADIDAERARSAASTHGIPQVYTDGTELDPFLRRERHQHLHA